MYNKYITRNSPGSNNAAKVLPKALFHLWGPMHSFTFGVLYFKQEMKTLMRPRECMNRLYKKSLAELKIFRTMK